MPIWSFRLIGPVFLLPLPLETVADRQLPPHDGGMTDQFDHDPAHDDKLPPARPAATLVVFDESRPGTPPSLLMVRRSEKMVFAGGAVVFPGGRVDEDDHAVAARFAAAGVSDDGAFRVAAIRETIEETGLGVGLDGVSDFAGVSEFLRVGLNEGRAFSQLLDEAGASLTLDTLVPFARWLPKLHAERRFDTRFYIVRAPAVAATLSVDHSENTALFWSSAQRTLSMADEGSISVIYPTRRNLERLAQYGSFDEALDCTRRHPPEIISPVVEKRDDGLYLCIPHGHGYPVTEERLEAAIRG